MPVHTRWRVRRGRRTGGGGVQASARVHSPHATPSARQPQPAAYPGPGVAAAAHGQHLATSGSRGIARTPCDGWVALRPRRPSNTAQRWQWLGSTGRGSFRSSSVLARYVAACGCRRHAISIGTYHHHHHHHHHTHTHTHTHYSCLRLEHSQLAHAMHKLLALCARLPAGANPARAIVLTLAHAKQHGWRVSWGQQAQMHLPRRPHTQRAPSARVRDVTCNPCMWRRPRRCSARCSRAPRTVWRTRQRARLAARPLRFQGWTRPAVRLAASSASRSSCRCGPMPRVARGKCGGVGVGAAVAGRCGILLSLEHTHTHTHTRTPTHLCPCSVLPHRMPARCAQVVLCFLLDDVCFYTYHRCMHSSRWL